MTFKNYLEDENDKPYFTTNSLAYYYDKMEGFAKAVEGSAKALNLTKEEIEQRIALRLAEWDKNLESFDGSVEKLLTEWVDDGTLTHVIDGALIDQKIAPVTAQLEETDVELKKRGIPLSQFGAIGDGVIDDANAIETALLSGNLILGDPKKVYRIGREINGGDNAQFFSETKIPIKIKPSGSFRALRFNGELKATTTLSQDVMLNTTDITLADTSSVTVGDILVMKSNSLWYYDPRESTYKGETHVVEAVNGLVVTLRNPLWDTYKVANETVTVSVYKPVHVQLENISIIYEQPRDVAGISINYGINPRIKNVKIENARLVGISLNSCYRADFHDVQISGSDFVSSGYGIQDSNSSFTEVSKSQFYSNRRGIDFSGGVPSRGGTVKDCLVIGKSGFADSSGFGTHGGAEHISFEQNTLMNLSNGIVFRGANLSAKNNRFIGYVNYGFVLQHGTNYTITDNEYDSNVVNKNISGSPNGLNNQMNTFVQLSTDNLTGKVTIKRNRTLSLRKCFLQIGNVTTMKNIICEDNEVDLRSTSGVTTVHFVYHGFTGVTVTDSRFLNNNVKNSVGSYTKFESGITLDFNTCFFDDINASGFLLVEKWGGDGEVATVLKDLKLTRLEDRTVLSGYVTFDIITGNTSVRLSGLPNKTIQDEPSYLYMGETFRKGVLKFISADHSRLYISYHDTGYNGQFLMGTGYRIPINIHYKTR